MMGEEFFVSGYCRAMDHSRTVTVEEENGQWYADCGWGNCPYEGNCLIAAELREKTGPHT